MVKIRVTSPVGFNDLIARKIRKFGEEFEVTEERAKFLESKNVIEIIEVKPVEDAKVEENATNTKQDADVQLTEKKSTKKKKKIDTKNK